MLNSSLYGACLLKVATLSAACALPGIVKTPAYARAPASIFITQPTDCQYPLGIPWVNTCNYTRIGGFRAAVAQQHSADATIEDRLDHAGPGVARIRCWTPVEIFIQI
jgi:hypothetical protein